jgi:glycerol-1-phosphate dehydrogenase [NAD(P)+]
VLLLYDENTIGVGGHEIMAALNKEDIEVSDHLVKNSDEVNVARVKRAIIQKRPDLVIGFGGGKVLDVAKLAAGGSNTRLISIPTTLSNDGLASPVAVIKDSSGIPVSHITKPPYGVIIDIDVVKGAPVRHLMAGIGDLISNLSAVFDARLAQAKNAEVIDDRALELAEVGGIRLLELHAKDINSSTFLGDLAQGLIKSGLAMCISGTSRPASGSEHKISHSIDHYFPPSKGLHGEQVGVAAIFTMHLQKNKYLRPVRKFYAKIGFPDKLSYLDLNGDEFSSAVMNATKIRPERYTILEDMKPTAEDIKRALRSTRL